MRRAVFVLEIAALAIVGGGEVAQAQRIDPRRPTTLVVGPPPGAAPMQRIDAKRSGQSKTPLPTGALRVAFRKPTGLTIDQPALVGADGMLAVVSVRGDVTFLDESGEERAVVKVGGAQVSPATMTSDGTVVFMTSGGEAIGVKRTSAHPRFATRIGGERGRAAPLPLDDGGVALATATDLVVLDSEGNIRARSALPETPSAPLIAAGDKILAVTTTGAVFGWTPGREPIRLGSFGAPIDGGATLVDGLLLGVIEGNHLAEVDIRTGGRATRALAPQGLYLGPPAIRTTASGEWATLLGLTQSRGFIVTLDASGQETLRAPIASLTPTALPDGGAPPLVVVPHAAPLVDTNGTIAWASTEGHVGIVTPDGLVETEPDTLCQKNARAGIVGLTPFGAGAFAVTCEGGVVARVTGATDQLRKPPAPSTAPSSSARPSDKLRPSPRDPSPP